ncbi:hypothetical protein ACHAWF_008297, partial [Thalassiosira exigua]
RKSIALLVLPHCARVRPRTGFRERTERAPRGVAHRHRPAGRRGDRFSHPISALGEFGCSSEVTARVRPRLDPFEGGD